MQQGGSSSPGPEARGRGKRRRSHTGPRRRRDDAPSAAFLEALEAQRRGSSSSSSAAAAASSSSSSSTGRQRQQQQQQQPPPARPLLPGYFYDEERQRYFPIGRGQPGRSSASRRGVQGAESREVEGVKTVGQEEAAGSWGWRGLTRGLIKRQVWGVQGLNRTRVLVHVTATGLDISPTRVVTAFPDLQDVDVRRGRLVLGSSDGIVTILEHDREHGLLQGLYYHHLNTPVSCVRWCPSREQRPCTVAIAETGMGQQPAAVTICRRSELNTGDDDSGALMLDRFVIKRDSVRTLAWEEESAAPEKLVVGVSRGQPLVVLDLRAGKQYQYGVVGSDIKACDLFNGGREVLYGSRNGEVRLVDLRVSGGGGGGGVANLSSQAYIGGGGTIVLTMSSSVDHQHVLKDRTSLVVSDEAGGLRRADLRMPGRPILSMEGHVCSLSSPHFAVSPSESTLLAVGSDTVVRAFSLTRGGPPLRSWPALSVFEGHVGDSNRRLFLCPGSWGDTGRGDDGTVDGELWMGSRRSGDVYRIGLAPSRTSNL